MNEELLKKYLTELGKGFGKQINYDYGAAGLVYRNIVYDIAFEIAYTLAMEEKQC